MLNYGITQNQQVSLNDLNEESLHFDLSLFEQMGDRAYKLGDEVDAINWYTKGLAAAREVCHKDKIALFSNLILASL